MDFFPPTNDAVFKMLFDVVRGECPNTVKIIIKKKENNK
jgi:hypothetical protein